MRYLSKVIKATRVSLGKEIELDTPIIQKNFQNFEEEKKLGQVLKADDNLPKVDEDIIGDSEIINDESTENGSLESDVVNAEINSTVVESVKTQEEIESMYMEEARKKSELFFEEEMKKAYDEGMKKAETEANEILVNAQNESTQILENSQIEAEKIVNEAIELKNKIAEDYKATLDSVEKDIIDMVVEIAERVIVKEIKKGDYIVGVVSEALEKLASKKDAILKVAEEDYEYIITNKEKILLNVEGFGEVEIVKEASLEKGSCIVESSFGIIDGSVKTQIKREIHKVLNR